MAGLAQLPGGKGKNLPHPKADPDWHPTARDWYNSLALSGQSGWYEPSDWMMAMTAAELLTYIHTYGYNGALLKQFTDMSARLLCGAGDRRRSRIALVRAGSPDEDDAAAEAEVLKFQRQLSPVKGGTS